MQFLVISVVLVSVQAIPHRHGSHSSHNVMESTYGHRKLPDSARLGATYGSSLVSGSYNPCRGGKILNALGKCVYPIVNRSIYTYAAPQRQYNYPPPPYIPEPKLKYHVVFVATPEGPKLQDPIIVPPSQQQTVVYVLSKNQELEPRKVIQIPDQNRKPEVYYVNYEDGENGQLPGGIDLESALKVANKRQGEFIEDIETEKSSS